MAAHLLVARLLPRAGFLGVLCMPWRGGGCSQAAGQQMKCHMWAHIARVAGWGHPRDSVRRDGSKV
eukprot:1146079-Pelagomonas_calceolata.AAC.7